MKFPERHGYVWRYPEINQVMNEYYKGWDIEKIAKKHKRTVRSIEYFLNRRVGREISDIIINNINFTDIISMAKKVVSNKVDLDHALSGGKS